MQTSPHRAPSLPLAIRRHDPADEQAGGRHPLGHTCCPTSLHPSLPTAAQPVLRHLLARLPPPPVCAANICQMAPSFQGPRKGLPMPLRWLTCNLHYPPQNLNMCLALDWVLQTHMPGHLSHLRSANHRSHKFVLWGGNRIREVKCLAQGHKAAGDGARPRRPDHSNSSPHLGPAKHGLALHRPHTSPPETLQMCS